MQSRVFDSFQKKKKDKKGRKKGKKGSTCICSKSRIDQRWVRENNFQLADRRIIFEHSSRLSSGMCSRRMRPTHPQTRLCSVNFPSNYKEKKNQGVGRRTETKELTRESAWEGVGETFPAISSALALALSGPRRPSVWLSVASYADWTRLALRAVSCHRRRHCHCRCKLRATATALAVAMRNRTNSWHEHDAYPLHGMKYKRTLRCQSTLLPN